MDERIALIEQYPISPYVIYGHRQIKCQTHILLYPTNYGNQAS